MTEISRAMLAQGLGEYILKYLREKPYFEENLVERECASVVRRILDTLNDETLDDFYCLDRIVNIIHGAGLSTSRHSF